jgi:hypothetical protein
MSRRVLLAVPIGAVLLTLLAWGTFLAGDAATPPAPPPAATGSAASHALAAPAPTPPTAATERQSADASAASLPQRRVRVIDERGTPVANADVAWDLSEELCEHWRPFPFDVEERLRERTAPSHLERRHRGPADRRRARVGDRPRR